MIRRHPTRVFAAIAAPSRRSRATKMRIVAFALSLSLAATLACKSSSSEDERPRRAEPRPQEDQAGAGVAEQPEAAAPDAPKAAPQDPQDLQREWERLTLAEQKKVFLVEQHIAEARDLKARLRLEEAERELAEALELDPDNLEAKNLMAEVGALLGRPAGATESVIEGLSQEYDIRVQQLYEEARDNYRKAKVLLARGDYEGAIVELSLCLDHIRWAPYSVDWKGLDQEAAQLLESAKAQKAASEESAREDARRAALQSLKDQEEAERERRQAIVRNLLNQSIASFEAAEYDEAIDYAERVLRQEPQNERARDLRDTAFRAGREKMQADFLRAKREQYARWHEETYELRIPYTDVVTLPDQDYWRQITDLRSRRRGLDLSHTVTASEAELRRQVAETRIPGLTISDEESLIAVIDALKVITGLPLVVDPAAEEAAVAEGVVFDFDFRNPLKVEEALNLFTEMAGPEVTWTIRHDTVLVTTREKARGQLEIYNHDVQDLIFGLTDFLGPRINRLRLVDDLEDDDGGGPFGGIGEKPTINEPDELVELITNNVAVDTWEAEGISITPEGGNIVIVQTPEVQMQVRQFLEDLRRFSASLVTIESKFMTIADNYLQEIGVDFRGLENPGTPFTDFDDLTNRLEDDSSLGLDNSGTGLDAGSPSSGFFYDDGQDGDFKGRTENFFGSPLGNSLSTIGGLTAQLTFLNDLQLSAILRLVEKNENVELINDQVLSVHNTQRAFVTVINQRAYIQDFDVEVAQFESVADPVINVLTEGIVLDVRPTIHHDRRYLTLEVQPTVADIVALTNFSTALAGQTQPVTFQLPELEVQSVFTTAVVPDGGSILVGGLSRLRNVERRAEVPWLANFPLIGFFFKEEGYSDEKESLMILITAWITDVKEELAKLDRGE